jgi:hypothetical protein
VYIFNCLPATLAHVPNILVTGLHYVLIYVSYNEILFLLYLFKLVQQNPHLSYERVYMAELDDCSISQPGHLVRSRLGGTYDSVSIQNLCISRLHMLK